MRSGITAADEVSLSFFLPTRSPRGYAREVGRQNRCVSSILTFCSGRVSLFLCVRRRKSVYAEREPMRVLGLISQKWDMDTNQFVADCRDIPDCVQIVAFLYELRTQEPRRDDYP